MGDGGNATDTTQPADGADYDFFVSYTGVDAAWAEWIAWQLEGRVRFGERSARVFVQKWDLVPGTNWAAGMHRTLPASARVVPVLSPVYLADSRYGNAEWLTIWPDDPEGLERRVVPVRVAECQPEGLLRSTTYIDLVGRDETAAADTLLAGITASVEGRAKPTVAPLFPGPDGPARHAALPPRRWPGPATALPRHPTTTAMAGPVPAADASTATASTVAVASSGTRGGGTEPAVTVLHISDTQFGAHHAGLTEADRAHSSLFGRLHDDLRDRAEVDGLRPDLVVVTGDLAETGDEGEFDQAYDFLVALTENLGLKRNQVMVIPGNHDVNRLLCQSHFLHEQAFKRTPEPPYWPKWRCFNDLLRRFYGADTEIGFQVGTEWSLFEVPDRNVVVAGLNSTMAESHEEHYGWLGEGQLRAVAEVLCRYERDGWLRIGAVHHNPIRGATSDDENLRDADDLDRILGPHLNLLLHGHAHDGRANWLSGLPVVATGSAAEVPNQYQLLRIDRDGFTRYARRYEPDQKRWTGDLRVDPAGSSWSVRAPHAFRSVYAAFPPPAETWNDDEEGEPGQHTPGRHRHEPYDRNPYGQHPYDRDADGDPLYGDEPPGQPRRRPPDTLDEVAEVARLHHPAAKVKRIDAVGELPAHLRVWRAEGRFAEQRVVGLVDGTADEAAVEEFAWTVRAKYLAAFPGLITELVYTGGTQAAQPLVAHAERLGVQLLSMPEYQGVLDLRGYVGRQSDRLRTDRDYPPELYVPQRIRRVGRTAAAVPGPALDQIVEWLTTDEARFILVLGDSGHGKTFLTHELALALPHHLPHVDPMLIELRHLEKSLEIDRLVAQHLVDSQIRRPDLDAFRYMLAQGRLILIFDGFDELAARVTYERASAHLDTLLAALDNQAKIVVTSRAEFFLTDDEVLKKTGKKVERTFGRFIVRLEEFTPTQIHDFLVGRFTRTLAVRFPDPAARAAEAERRASTRLQLIENVRDLPDLARNPRLLTFIAELDEKRLDAARQRGGTVTA
ncbi:TIR domain-containing protein, partial [Frankia sp. Cj5]|uniref:TIR domain-containing protein n=2 Tax=unclassified Frankia TaxID=2632575 RepID=UPI001EF4DA75